MKIFTDKICEDLVNHDSVGVGATVVVFQLTNILAKLFDYFSDKLSTMALYEIIIPCNDKDIHGIDVVRVFQLECMEEGL